LITTSQEDCSVRISRVFSRLARIAPLGFACAIGLLPLQATAESTAQAKTAEQVIPLVNQYCGACHAVPPPNILPKASWPRVIDSMVELARHRTGQEFIPAEHLDDIKALYFGSAPTALPRLPYIDQPSETLAFAGAVFGEDTPMPLILNIQAVDLKLGAKREFLVSDGERGRLTRLYEDGEGWHEEVLAELPIPIQARVVDFTGNGLMDIVVADLGAFPPQGVLAGKIFLLRQVKPGEFAREQLISGLGRVTDVQVLELSGKGRLDLAVAVFGGGEVGEVFWAENLGDGTYRKHLLLALSGALNITPVDLDGDGQMDLVSLVAQEHELLVAFMNRGEGRFERVDLFQAPHPMFGSTSLIAVDLDRDGDMDLVFANGDAFDTQTDPKPYHGVQWLENLGDMEFRYHDIGRFYGATKIAAGDLDGDGDLDLVVSSWANDWEDPKRQSLVWFENDGKQQFTARPLVAGVRGLAAIELADLNDNGRLDILAGAFRMDLLARQFLDQGGDEEQANAEKSAGPGALPSPRLLVFENIRASPPQENRLTEP
jgi:hypothetical protein